MELKQKHEVIQFFLIMMVLEGIDGNPGQFFGLFYGVQRE